MSQEGHRATRLELFFDLAFVFAFTQLSRLMALQHSAVAGAPTGLGRSAPRTPPPDGGQEAAR